VPVEQGDAMKAFPRSTRAVLLNENQLTETSMKVQGKQLLFWLAVLATLSANALAQSLPGDIKAKAEAKINEIKAWGSDPQVVAAVQAYNSSPPVEAKGMTNDKWKELSVLDPGVRSFSKNTLGEFLKSKKDDSVSEAFVSGADGGKVAFLSKPTSWNHKGKPKHEVPMTGKVFIGPIEMDESSGQQQFQVGVPVLADGKPVGSIVVGLKVVSLR
jgi:hypothetical protein